MQKTHLGILTAILLSCLAAAPCPAQEQKAFKATILYHVASPVLEKNLNSNPEQIFLLKEETARLHAESIQVDSITIVAACSPEGTLSRNLALANDRAQSAHDFLRTEIPFLPTDRTRIILIDEDWNNVLRFLENHEETPNQKEAMKIIRTTPARDFPTYEQAVSARKQKLQALPRTWEYLITGCFTYLRKAEITLWYKEGERQSEPALPKPDNLINRRDTIYIRELVDTVLTVTPSDIVVPAQETYVETAVAAIGTNLLYDAGTMVNLSTEIPFAHHWSFKGEVIFPRFRDWRPYWNNNFAPLDLMQLTDFDFRMKYYFKGWAPRDNQVMRGAFIQIGPGFGYFDAERGGTVIIGNEAHVSVGGGVAIPIGQWFRLSISVDWGPTFTAWKRYYGTDITGAPQLIGQYRQNYWLPNKAEVSFQYILNRKKYQDNNKH